MTRQAGIADVVSHPVRLRILQSIGGRELTTAQLREALPDVAQATLYRHVSALVEGGYLTVVGERRARGAVERTYALGDRMAHVDEQELQELSADQLRAAFLAFISELTRTFDGALEQGDAARRQLGFGSTIVYVDHDDLGAIQRGLGEVLGAYRDASPDKQRVMLSTVLLPSD